MTCLHLAVLSGSNELVKLLIAHGAEREALANVRTSFRCRGLLLLPPTLPLHHEILIVAAFSFA